MELVRKTIQNENFKSLLDLSFGSALAIALDTSDSMSNEKDAVLAEIIEIINAIRHGQKFQFFEVLWIFCHLMKI